MIFTEIREFKLGKSGCCHGHPYLSDDGAFFGNDAPLLEKDSGGRWRPRPRVALERDLSRALGTSIDLDWRMESFATVARALNKGDRSLAAIALVHAELPGIPRARPRHPTSRFSKDGHDVSDEQRIPAGQTGAGRWTIGGVLAAASAEITNLGAEAAAVLLHGGRTAMAALTEFGAGLADPVALAGGLMLIPIQRSAVSEGALSDRDDIKYRYDEGALSVWRTHDDGPGDLLYSGRADADGLYRDADGNVIGRDLGTSVAVNAPAITEIADARPTPRSQAGVQADTDAGTGQPQLCPDPTPDVGHGASSRSVQYQAQISGLPPGLAVWLNGTSFDGCRTSDGVMLEAKGPGYLWALSPDGWRPGYNGGPDAEAQMIRQSNSAAGRIVEWHVAESPVADYFRDYASRKELSNIVVIHTPARMP